MKKVGILTLYYGSNFGGTLQAFAMKRVIELLGFEVEQIPYKQPRLFYNFSPFVWRKLLTLNIRFTIKYLLEAHIRLKKAKRYAIFYEKYINNTKKFVDNKHIPSDKDYYILGSDQIWTLSVTGGFDGIFYGDFPSKKGSIKIAYAASAEDMSYTPENIKELNRLLKNLDYIGVREKTLAENLIANTNRKDIVPVIDPTMLVNPKIYEEINSIDPLPGKKYILFYKIRNCWNFIDKIHNYARSIGAELLIFSSWYEHQITKYAKKHKDVTYLPEACVEEFLGAIKNSECIFSPSFHACIFSIIYRKPFFSLLLSDTWNTRAADILTGLDLKDRLLPYDKEIRNDNLDFDKVNKEIQQKRNESLSFLKNALNIKNE